MYIEETKADTEPLLSDAPATIRAQDYLSMRIHQEELITQVIDFLDLKSFIALCAASRTWRTNGQNHPYTTDLAPLARSAHSDSLTSSQARNLLRDPHAATLFQRLPEARSPVIQRLPRRDLATILDTPDEPIPASVRVEIQQESRRLDSLHNRYSCMRYSIKPLQCLLFTFLTLGIALVKSTDDKKAAIGCFITAGALGLLSIALCCGLSHCLEPRLRQAQHIPHIPDILDSDPSNRHYYIPM